MKFLPDFKELFDKPPEEKKMRYRYVIYKWIEMSSYYGYKNDIDGILENVELTVQEEMRAKVLRE
jgi:pre-mRNA-splicing factor ISY1